MNGITVVVTGGRRYADRARVYDELDRLNKWSLTAHSKPIGLLIEGGQTGADTLARDWAWIRSVESRREPADWKRYGRAAGPIRNRTMLDYQPAYVVAFPGGVGTADCVRQARARGIPVLVVGAAS